MQYMIIIHTDEKANAKVSAKEREEGMGAWIKYSQDLKKSGVMLAGDPLHPTSRGAAHVTVRNGKRNVTDGPFAEAKEVVGGYYLIQVKSHEEAVEWAARCPGALYGTIELREVNLEFSAPK